MVNQTDAAAEESSAAADGGENQEAKQPTVKELQARLQEETQARKSAEGRLKSRERSSAIAGEAIAEMESRIGQTLVKALTTAFEIEDPIERGKAIEQVHADHRAQAALAAEITKAQPQLDDIVDQSGKSFDDPQFANAKQAWDQGRPNEALLLARLAVTEARTGDAIPREQVEEIVRAEVKNQRIADARVDTGSSTASTGDEQRPRTRAELATHLASRRAAGNPVKASELSGLVADLQD